MDIKQLTTAIEQANTAYYDRNDPIISDDYYDELIARLRDIDPENELIRQVGGVTHGKLVKHSVPMMSLDKVYSWDELVEWCEHVSRDKDELFCFSCKYDGISCAVDNGKLITRGQGGEYGTDITHLAPWIECRLKWTSPDIAGSMENVLNPGTGTFGRMVGELLVPSERFESLKNTVSEFASYKNPRSMASGFASIKPNNFLLRKLKHDGKPITVATWVFHKSYEITVRLADIISDSSVGITGSLRDYLIKTLRDYNGCPCDGIVCRLSDETYGSTLGVTQHHPKDAMAFKFKDAEYSSIVTSIEWGVGHDAVTPVANIEPIKIEGVTVRRATCHNAKFIEDHHLSVGSIVGVVRRGGVIPKIVSVTPNMELPISIPTECPCCHQTLVRRDVDLVCINQSCRVRCTKKIVDGLHCLGIKGIGESLVERMVGEFYIPNIMTWALEAWDKQLLLDKGFTAHEIRMIVDEFDRVTNVGVSDADIFASLCIQDASTTFAEKVIKYTGDLMVLADDPDVVREKLKDCPGINSTALSHTIDFLIEHSGEFEAYYNLFVHKRPVDENNRLKFCFTGALPIPRKDMEQWVVDHGGYPVDNIRKADYLVSASATSTSDKMRYARQHDIPIISYEQLKSKLSNGD